MDPSAPLDPALVAAHAGGVRRLARGLVYGDDRVGDVVQETLLVALRAPASPRTNPAAWLYGVARNVARGLSRSDRRREAREREAARPEAVSSAAEVVAALEEQRRVLDALFALEEPCRTALFLRYLQGLPPRAIAARLSLPVETVKSQVKRGLARLRETLDTHRRGDRGAWMGALLPLAALAPASRALPLTVLGGVIAAGAVLAFWLAGPGRAAGTATTPRAATPPAERSPGDASPAPRGAPDSPPLDALSLAPDLVPGAVPDPVLSRAGAPSPVEQGTIAKPGREAPAGPAALAPGPTRPAGNAAREGPLPAAMPGLVDVPVDGPLAPVPPRVAPAGPGGMVYVDTGAALEARVGTSASEAQALALGRKDVLLELSYETPVHAPALRPYFMDATEVSNAQYMEFLDQTARTTHRTGASAPSTLPEIASSYAYGDPQSAEGAKDDRSWGQLFELNRSAIEAAMPAIRGMKDEKARLRSAALPADLVLTVYRRRLPAHWFESSGALEGDAAPDLPVRNVSYLDAAAFAAWAGKHVPTEEEWEWAARGPKRHAYPWGDDWTEGVGEGGRRVVEGRCNWLDLGVVDRRREPAPMPVETLPDGRSWCGCFHMLGNVAEWTSSWFSPYPGWVDPSGGDRAKNRYLDYQGDFVRVIRGGSCADRERLVLRLAARNFEGNGPAAPPRPESRFPYTGFRCAAYLAPGLDRLEPAVSSLVRPKRISPEQLAIERFAGTMATHWLPAGQHAESHVFVTGGASAILLEPMASLSARLPRDAHPRGRTPREILDAAREEEPVVLAVFHSDIAIDRASVALPRKEEGEKPWTARKHHALVPEPPTAEGKIPAGSYLLGLWFKKAGLFQADLEFVGFVGDATLDALGKDEAPAPSSLAVDPVADLVRCSFWMPVGGKGTDPAEGVTVRFSFSTEAGAIERAGAWR